MEKRTSKTRVKFKIDAIFRKLKDGTKTSKGKAEESECRRPDFVHNSIQLGDFAGMIALTN